MAAKRRFRARIATWMSGIFVAALFISLAGRAEGAEAAASVKDDLDARHRIGLQLGGSSFIQFVYRLRLFSHVYLEAGGAGAPEATLNASAGIMVAHRTGTRFFPYVASGAGFGGSGGGNLAGMGSKCVDGTDACPWQSDGVGYGYARGGVGMMFGVNHNASLLLDFGAWMGTQYHHRDDGKGTLTDVSRRFVWPMPGLAMFASF